jgi:sterol 3beta-glucosyltransferase
VRFVIASMDTRGGIQPYLALGLGLKGAGHDVLILAPSDFGPVAAAAGLAVAPLSGNVEETVRALGGAAEGGRLRSMRTAGRELGTRIETWTREALEACEGGDAVLGGVGGMVIARSVAEKLRLPFIEAHVQPVGAPTDRYQGPLFGGTPRILGGPGRRLSHRVSEMGVWMPFSRPMHRARSRVLGLDGPMRREGDGLVLYGFSPHVVPVPADGHRERVVTGYWVLLAQDAWAPPPELESFLATDRPVVSIGFGSMASEDPTRLAELVTGAARDAGVRAVLLSGWGGIAGGRGEDVFATGALPHDWLFPRMHAVVHHGGAGTTGAGLRAGVPNVVVPFTMDQPFWASRVAALGAGPSPIPRKRLTRTALTAALRAAIDDAAMRNRAAQLGTAIRAEDGVAAAVARLERLERVERVAR